MLVGDILVGIQGRQVSNHDELFAGLSGEVVGKSASLEVLRGGQLQLLNVTVQARQAEQEQHRHHEHHHHGHR